MPFGVDPKTVLCQYFKAGNCEKGKKCKFSHDLDVGRKQQKKSLYTDTREGEDEEDGKKKEEEGMDDWDEGMPSQLLRLLHGILCDWNEKTLTSLSTSKTTTSHHVETRKS